MTGHSDRFSPERWRALSPYLDQALELGTEDRAAWLASLRASDAALAADLEALLREGEDGSAQDFLEDSAAVRPPVPSLAGQAVGAYTLRSLIGSGGMGSVWLAERSDGRFEGLAAVKLLNVALAGRDGEGRFKREGNILARLRHPQIAQLVDAGVAPSGQPYLVLEYVDGDHIDRYCDAQRLGVEDRLRLFLDVLGAVAHAHANLVVHRDLKPSNVLVGSGGRVKLLDFGIAKLLDPETSSGESSALTREGESVLTPQYAAPEQLTAGQITTATDVYALGVLLYLLVTGRHPAGDRTTSPADLIRAIVDTEPARPSDAVVAPTAASDSTVTAANRATTPGRLRRALKGDLDNIIGKALRKDPAERYTNADLFAADLRRFLAHEPVTARAGTFGYRASRFVARHRGGVAAAAAVAATLLGAVVVTTRQLVETRRQKEAALASAQRAEATGRFLSLLLSDLQTRGEPLTAKALLERGSALLHAQYGDQPRFIAEMLLMLGNEYGAMLELDQSRALLGQARDIAARLGDDLLLARAECDLAEAEAQGDAYESIAERLASATRAMTRAQAVDAEIRVGCLRPQAALLEHNGQRDRALALSQDARRILEDAGATHGKMYNGVLSDIASNLMFYGRVPEALPIYRLSVEMHERNGRAGTRAHFIAQQNVGTALYRLGEVRESWDMTRRILELRSRLVSGDDISVTAVIGGAIEANRLLLDDPALGELPALLDRAEKAGDMNNFRLASAELARTRLIKGASRDEVEAPIRHLEAVHHGTLPTGSRVLAESIRAQLDLAEGHPAEADARAAALLKEIGYPKVDRPRTAFLAIALAARTALANGDAERAARQAQEAVDLTVRMARGPDTSADVGESLLLLGRAKAALGATMEARPLLQRAVRCLANGYGADHPATREARKLLAGIEGPAGR